MNQFPSMFAPIHIPLYLAHGTVSLLKSRNSPMLSFCCSP